MAAMPTGFDARTTEPQAPRVPIPAGDYEVVIIESEWKDNSKKTGRMLAFVFEVVSGDMKGKKLYVNLNLENPNAEAVDIARREMAEICRAVKVFDGKDTAELHDLPIMAKVGIEKRKDTGELQNKIRAYSAKETPTASNPTAVGGLSTASPTAPWKKK